MKIFPRQNLILFAAWNPDEENPYGASVFRSMPFLVDVLLKIYSTIGTNWERAGNVRYSVVYKPGDASGQIDAQERSEQIAEQWSQAMQESRHGVVRDFVAVGDVQIKVIGADGQILDSEVPVQADSGAARGKDGASAVSAGAQLGVDRTDERAADRFADLRAVGNPPDGGAGFAADLQAVDAAARICGGAGDCLG